MSYIDELINDDKKIDNRGICMDFLKFMYDEPEKKDIFFECLSQLKSGSCPFKGRCDRYSLSLEKYPTYVCQLNLF